MPSPKKVTHEKIDKLLTECGWILQNCSTVNLDAAQTVALPKNRGSRPEVYTSKIIKAGALLSDTRMLLTHWDENVPVADNLERFLRQNLFGKTSRSRIEDIVGIFSQRYLREPAVLRALVSMCRSRISSRAIDKILYFHACRADRLLHDIVTEILYEFHVEGRSDISTRDIQQALWQWIGQGKTASEWADYTVVRTSRGLLSALRDFGILTGAAKKRMSPVFLPVEAFAYIAFYLAQEQPSGDRLLRHPEWRIFLLSTQQVERLFLETHQSQLLKYHAAGSVIRIDFPAKTLDAYANVIAKTAH